MVVVYPVMDIQHRTEIQQIPSITRINYTELLGSIGDHAFCFLQWCNAVPLRGMGIPMKVQN